MRSIAYLALAIGLLVLSVRSFADVSGVWPLPGAGSQHPGQAAAKQLQAKPLDARAYYALGLAAERAGEDKRAQALFDHAIELDPRLRAPRLSLLTIAADAKNAAAAVKQARVLAVLNPEATGPIATILAGLARDSAARPVIAREMKNSPLILAVASRAAASGVEPSAVRELLAPTDLAAVPNGVAAAQALLVPPLMKDGRFKEARDTWYALAGLSPKTAVFDGAFEGLPGGAPFGWTLRSGTDVQTSIEAAAPGSAPHALEVTAFGSLPVDAAEQTLVLSAGRHKLTFDAASDVVPSAPPAFAWRINCSKGPLITEVPIALSRAGWHKSQATFDVPSACPSQVLRLTKLRTADAAARKLDVTAVAVTPL